MNANLLGGRGASSRGGRGKRRSGREGWAYVERASLRKHRVDVPYRGGLEGVP